MRIIYWECRAPEKAHRRALLLRVWHSLDFYWRYVARQLAQPARFKVKHVMESGVAPMTLSLI